MSPAVSRIILATSFLFALVGAFAAAAPAPPKIPLDYKAYDGWRAIRSAAISDDGRYAAYALVPQDGDPTLVVHDFATGKDIDEPRGITPAFTADARFVVYAVRAPNADIRKATRAHKKPDEQPKNGLGVLDLTTGTAVTVDRVKDFKLARDAGSDTLAYALESPLPAKPSPGPSASGPASAGAPSSSSPSPMPSASASPSPVPSGTPPDELHKKDDGAMLVIEDLKKGTTARVPAVTDYEISHDGAYVAYAVQSKDGTTDAVRIRTSDSGSVDDPTLDRGVTLIVMSAAGHYKNLTFAAKRDVLAFVSDASTFASSAPRYAVYQSDVTRRVGATIVTRTPPSFGTARVLVDATGAFASAPPSENGKLEYTKDGSRLYFGVAAAPTPVPSGTPEPVKVDIWNWHDLDLQSRQRKDADDERKRTYAATVASDGSGAVRLATTTMRTLVTNQNQTVALGLDDVRYRQERSWDTDYRDVYAVSLRDGSRRLLITKLRDDASLSPAGAFVVAYDMQRRSWYSVDTHTGKRMDLTSRLRVPFYDVLDDHPAPPPPYGLAGWAGDRYVLLQDRYDVWAIDPRTAHAHVLTGGIGRARHIAFVPEQTDLDADAFDPAAILLHARDDETKDQGLWRVAAVGRTAFVPQLITMLPKAVTFVAKARGAARIVFAEQSFSEGRDLFSAPDVDAPLVRLSDANPQRARYLWGTERLVSYRSTWGVPLRGILYTPDTFDARKRYPMLVYFYERFSDSFHEMPFTTPGPFTSPNLLRYVSNGYVVFVPDVAYRVGHPGESALDCILPGIDSVVKRGFVDPARIGVAGHSWAAYQIAYMLTRTNRFRAAEAGAAVANMTSAYGGIRLESGDVREFQYERSQSRIGATPWDRTDLYVENSPLFHIRNVNTPYLSMANELDGAVPQLQGIEFFTALRRLGKEAYLFSFDGEEHNLKGREQAKYWTVHLDEFFDHFLRGKPEPDWMSHGVDFLHRGERDVDRDDYGETP